MTTVLTINWVIVLDVGAWLCLFGVIWGAFRDSGVTAHEKALKAANDE